ncbi:MAG: alpha/beta hydrolase [Beijerinckiaceae bacterium]|nr:alpha/beta hydrolase [Beijerinckiaceae bacterium]
MRRRAFLRALACTLPAAALAACSPGLGSDLATFETIKKSPARSSLESEPVLFAATTRRAVAGGKSPWFGGQRSDTTSLVRVTLDPPSRTIVGSVASSVTGDWEIQAVEPVPAQDAARALAEHAQGRDLLIYVHGFNETFESAVLGAANLSHGVRFNGVTALFSWPSKAGLLDYGYDRESALWSRDGFDEMLETLAKENTIGRIHIVAHSMGTLLTIETLRQFKARTGDQYVGKFGAIVLASPDIDVDVFTTTVGKIGYYANKITVITSTDDRALDISKRMAGGVTRLGAADSSQIRQLGVKVVDASGLDWGLIKHDRFLSNTEVRGAVRRAIDTAD